MKLRRDTKTPPKVSVVNCCDSEEVRICTRDKLSPNTNVIAREMTASTTRFEMDRKVMIFLNSVHNIDCSMMSIQKAKPSTCWLKTYNFQSLLKLPRGMEICGPLINLW